MSYLKVLVGEVSTAVDELMDRNEFINPEKVTTVICSNHQHELVNDAPFSTFNNYTNVRRVVRQVISKKTDPFPDGEKTNQLTIEGFNHVQKYYCIEREGEMQGVPVVAMSDEEIDNKCDELIKMGRTCFAHAKELKRFKEVRIKA